MNPPSHTTTSTHRSVPVALLGAGAALLAGLLGGCALPEIDAPAGDVPLLTVAAHGVQIDECRAATGATPAWSFLGPQADLFDAEGRRIGQHGFGPRWQHDVGSGFVGSVRSRVEAPRPRAIPWLLLAARSQGPRGVFAHASSVQRVNTVGGQPPHSGCSTMTLGTQLRMAYRADYVLHVPRT